MENNTSQIFAGLDPIKVAKDVASSESTNVPNSTKRYRAHGRPSLKDKAEGQQRLTPSEEEVLANCLRQMFRYGYPVPKKYLPLLARAIMRRHSLKFPTSTTSNRSPTIGKNWPQDFYKRHHGLKASMSRRRDWNLHVKNMHRNVQNCFKRIKEDFDYEDILPENFHTMDEMSTNHIDTHGRKEKVAFKLPLRNQQKQSETGPARWPEKLVSVDEKRNIAGGKLPDKCIIAKTSSNSTKGTAEIVIDQSSDLIADCKHTRLSLTSSKSPLVSLEGPTSPQTTSNIASYQLSCFFANGSTRQIAYTDSEIRQVSHLLSQVNVQWAKVPRTYIVLLTIGCLDLLETFIDLGISDHWFPFTQRGLPLCLRDSKRPQFIVAQQLIMTKSMDLERGDMGQHQHYQAREPLPFNIEKLLGDGGFGRVDRISSKISSKEYALKRVSKSNLFSGPAKLVKKK